MRKVWRSNSNFGSHPFHIEALSHTGSLESSLSSILIEFWAHTHNRSLLTNYLHVFLFFVYFSIPIFLFLDLCSKWAKETHNLGMDVGCFTLYNSQKKLWYWILLMGCSSPILPLWSWLKTHFWFAMCFPSHRKSFSSISPHWESSFVMINGWVTSTTIWLQFPIVFQDGNCFGNAKWVGEETHNFLGVVESILATLGKKCL